MFKIGLLLQFADIVQFFPACLKTEESEVHLSIHKKKKERKRL